MTNKLRGKKKKVKQWPFKVLISDGFGGVWHEYTFKVSEEHSVDSLARLFIRTIRERGDEL